MSANTKIEWAHHTFNPWWGCVKVSPACEHCYAETFSKRVGQDVWGPGAPRRFFSDKHWNEPLKWDKAAGDRGVRARVFCASMADVLEKRADLDGARYRLLELIAATPNLDWMLLTKRPENAEGLLPQEWFDGEWPANVWIGVTVENQEYADRRLPVLLQIPAPVLFVSMEPLLGEVDLEMVALPDDHPAAGGGPGIYNALTGEWWPALGDVDDEIAGALAGGRRIDWVIVGGESGHGARPMHPDSPRSVQRQCVDAGVPFLFKQWGEWIAIDAMTAAQLDDLDLDSLHDRGRVDLDTHPYVTQCRLGKKAAGRDLDGRTWDEFPEGANG